MEDLDEGPRNNPWMAGGSNMNMNATTSEADMERAIAESMAQRQNQINQLNQPSYDEDEELARILEASKHIQ